MELTPRKVPSGTYTIDITSWNLHHRSYLVEISPWKLAHGTNTMEVTS